MEIPCKQCILPPICCHKSYSSLIGDCNLLKVCEPEDGVKLFEYLKPTKWYVYLPETGFWLKIVDRITKVMFIYHGENMYSLMANTNREGGKTFVKNTL